MSGEGSVRVVAVALATALATLVLARLAPHLGWTDAPRAADAGRKHQRRPVPAVGGAALLVGLACAAALSWSAVPWDADAWSAAPRELWGRWLPGPGWLAATLALLFAAGAWDDRAGLPAGKKALAQLAALAPLGIGAALQHGVGGALVLVLAGFTAVNLLNTFDNADGALASLCALGFTGAAPPAAAACLGFLPLNLDAGRARNRPSGAPSAYLGDAGAAVLAFLVLVTPASAGLLVLPGLDLARLALVRVRAGSRPWIGDRAHLAHRLAARGWSRPVVAAVQCMLALPACALVATALARDDARWAAAGVLSTLVLYSVALKVAPPPPGPG